MEKTTLSRASGGTRYGVNVVRAREKNRGVGYVRRSTGKQEAKETVRSCLEYAMEVRRRVKEQLKKIGGMEFYDIHFSYIDMETSEEKFISFCEQGGGALIPEGLLNPGAMHTVSTGGNDSLKMSGLGSNMKAKGPIKVGFDYFKASASSVSASVKVGDHDYHRHIVELQNTGPTTAMTLTNFIALCSAAWANRSKSRWSYWAI